MINSSLFDFDRHSIFGELIMFLLSIHAYAMWTPASQLLFIDFTCRKVLVMSM